MRAGALLLRLALGGALALCAGGARAQAQDGGPACPAGTSPEACYQ